MALVDIKPGDIVYVLDIPGAPLERCRVLKVGPYAADVERFGYTPTQISRFRIYAREFGPGCCTTCGKPPRQPYRRRDASGIIVEGCVDAIHDALDAERGPIEAEDRAWHDRPAAQRCRELAAARLPSF